ncbi:DUF4148 domain-containing protein [Pseudoduganella umbonata]|uniref:DUF4148 domain-containing protein n=1 Tax=Pseudoduganella umbonata TaxID=864828 RepID=A0A4P8HP45_9BURK|nr:DUF4148 domain-containing protein [Pseudoduganella umbonata]MBB3221051.1 hypothetical protein [Pseudoduganella umbonata]QCP10252.1 DUF4148 domain-containing protein [Pseudoduganella umbonata]
MKTTTNTIFAILLAAAGIANATNAQSQSLTREQVRAEVLAARAAGTLSSGGEGYQALVFDIPSMATRAEVRAELAAARAAGALYEGEAYPGPAGTPSMSPVTRAQVLAELAAARAAGVEHAGEAYPGPLAAGG